MCAKMSIEDKVYPSGDDKLSMTDMLAYFEKHGAMRVSDLHIKIGAQPAYRVDGDLVKLKGELITEDLAEKLIHPLIGEKNLETFRSQSSVDCSYRFGNLQFRINVFKENDGICAAIRALGLDIPYILFLVLFPIANIAGYLPISFGGLGTREFTSILIFTTLFSLSPEDVLVFTLMGFVVTDIAMAIIGFFLSLTETKKHIPSVEKPKQQ